MFQGPHFFSVLSINTKVDCHTLNVIPQRKTTDELDDELTYKEFLNALKKLTSHKAPETNSISPNGLKALSHDNKYTLFEYIYDCMEYDQVDYEDWHCTQFCPLPKKVDMSNPNNWREIHLLDVTSNIVSIGEKAVIYLAIPLNLVL